MCNLRLLCAYLVYILRSTTASKIVIWCFSFLTLMESACFSIAVICCAGGQVRCCIFVIQYDVPIEFIRSTVSQALGLLQCAF